jgi:hypothetical protein
MIYGQYPQQPISHSDCEEKAETNLRALLICWSTLVDKKRSRFQTICHVKFMISAIYTSCQAPSSLSLSYYVKTVHTFRSEVGFAENFQTNPTDINKQSHDSV